MQAVESHKNAYKDGVYLNKVCADSAERVDLMLESPVFALTFDGS